MSLGGGLFRCIWALMVLGVGGRGLSYAGSIVVGTGGEVDWTSRHAAVYCWGGTVWVKISPEQGQGLGSRSAVYSLCSFRGQLYAGTDSGQVYAYANGTAWVQTGWGGSQIPIGTSVLTLTEYAGDLYAGTKPAGLYRYDPDVSRWSKVEIDLYGMQGVAAMTSWTDPKTRELKLFLGDVYHDMIIAYNGLSGDKELSILAPVGSCIWDFQDYNGHLYACSYEGRVYVRSPERTASDYWSLATPAARGSYRDAWELEVFKGNLYVACDGTLERVLQEGSSWNGLKMGEVFTATQSGSATDAITTMVAGDELFFGTRGGRVFRYDGQNSPIQMGSVLPPIVAMHAGALLTTSLKIDTLGIVMDECVARNGPLTYRIDYGLSGGSSDRVLLVDELPVGVDLAVAVPEPNRIDGRILTWDFGKIGAGPLIGSVSVTVKPTPGLAQGSELVNTCLVFDGTVHMGGVQKRILYGVERLYVDPNAPPTHPDGCSWGTALKTLGEAVRSADVYGIADIWVAEGIYQIPQQADNGISSDALKLSSGISLRGGFTGHERSVQDRPLGGHPTVLVCPVAMDGMLVVDVGRTRNSDLACMTQTLIEAITFRGPGLGAQANGIYATTDRLTGLLVRDCTFEDCANGLFLADGSGARLEGCLFRKTGCGISAAGAGAVVDIDHCLFQENVCGAYLGEGMAAALRDSTFTQNGGVPPADEKYAGGVTAFCQDVNVSDCHFSGNRGRIGGGLYVSLPAGRTGTEVKISRCEFAGNTVFRTSAAGETRPTGQGGGLFIDQRAFVLTDAWFVGNTSSVAGGGLSARQSSGRMVRSFFYGNQVTGSDGCGGAAEFGNHLGVVGLYRSVFADNRAPYGGALTCTASGDYSTDLVNCTFVKNQGTLWAGGALSVCGEKADQRTIIGGRAVVTNCLFYGNTGKVDGTAMEVYAGSSLTLASSALDGPWYSQAVVWVERDSLKRPLGHFEVPDAYGMQVLSGSPLQPEVALDCHLRPPSGGQGAHPSDSGQAMAIPDANQDVDGDPVPLGGAWDIGADELDPNRPVENGWVWPDQVVCDRTANGAPGLAIYFRGAKFADHAAAPSDAAVLVRRSWGRPWTVGRIPIVRGGPGVTLDHETSEGNADGHVTFSVSGLRSGVYEARLVGGDEAGAVKAVSCLFFVRSTPPDPRISEGP